MLSLIPPLSASDIHLLGLRGSSLVLKAALMVYEWKIKRSNDLQVRVGGRACN